MMSMVNRPIVQRTWGLLQEGDPASAYGPNFKYIEFARTESWLGGVLLSLQLAVAGFLLSLRPVSARMVLEMDGRCVWAGEAFGRKIRGEKLCGEE